MSRDAILTISLTVPCAIILGIFWCYCMSKVCGTDQDRKQKPRLDSAAKASRDNLACDCSRHDDVVCSPGHDIMYTCRDLTPIQVEMDDELGLDLSLDQDDDISIGSSCSTHHPDQHYHEC